LTAGSKPAAHRQEAVGSWQVPWVPLQLTGVPDTHPAVGLQVSVPLQANPSSHVSGVTWMQVPVPVSQVSEPLQTFPSSAQVTGVPATQPVAWLQVSVPLQGLPSSQVTPKQ
jgi:hypothetical protein